MKVWIDGELVDGHEAKLSVFDHGVLYGDGVFEGIRAYGGKIFQARAHVDRLFESAQAIELKIPLSRQQVLEAMYETMQANAAGDAYIRLVVTRGAGTLGLDADQCADPAVFIIVDQVALYPKELYETGMAVIIAKTRRTSATMLPPRVKSCNYLNNILAKIEAVEAGVPEALMLNADGEVAEATGDNIFIVHDGGVITPPPAAGILIGITRQVVMRLCAKLQIPLQEERITPEQVYAADECFLTGTAAEVIAVTKVDDRPIGNGRPGPVTQRLLEAFHELIRSGKFE
jgi:branched-chain amino acid aminotransferase